MPIRAMTEADLDAVYRLEAAGHLFPWTLGILRGCLHVGYACFVLEEGEAIQAFGILLMAAGEGHLLNLCVDPELQGKGLGRQLLNFIVQDAKAKDINRIFLEVRVSNIRAQKLYEALGFTQIGVRKQYYPLPNGREDAIIFALNLDETEPHVRA